MTYEATATHTFKGLFKNQRGGIGQSILCSSRKRPLHHSRQKYFGFSKGQVTVELILLAVVLIFLSQLIIHQIKTNKYIEDFAKGPSQVVANMIANGNWKKEPSESREEHPNIHEKHYSWDP